MDSLHDNIANGCLVHFDSITINSKYHIFDIRRRLERIDLQPS